MKKDQNPVNLSDTDDIGNILPAIKGLEHFKVPETYFDQLPGRIHDRIGKESMPGILSLLKKMPYLKPRIVFPLAAAIIIIGGILIFLPRTKDSNRDLVMKQDSSVNMEEYDESYATEAQFEEFSYAYQTLQDSDLTNEVISGFISQNENSVSEQDIAEYLKDQDIDSDVLAEL
ncbi:MAG: hypothetical protein HXX13_11650 [Bacteroidetes bacterium]|nr:hypothetical protein [Bacteroidota bacterium]